MIPKIIHYCWFGNKSKPKDVLRCISTWQEVLPDFTIKEWNETNFDYKKFAYTYEAYKLKKYAFVSDVARLYALMTEGGIYLDTDVRVLKSFNPYLNEISFIGMESPYRVGTAVIGAESGVEWVKDFYDCYRKKHFISLSGALKNQPNTDLLTYFFASRYPYDEKKINRYGPEYFCGKIFSTNDYIITSKTVAVHEFSATWKSENNSPKRFENILKRIVVALKSLGRSNRNTGELIIC